MNPQFRQLPLGIAIALLFSPPARAADEPSVVEIETVTIFARGQTRQVQQLGAADFATAAPGTSPLKLLERLPGVNFSSADPAGAYEWSTKLTIRGFNQNQLGFTLDDVPLGDMSYRNHNGLHVSRAISTENLGRVTLSQGTGALDTASTSNLGGTVQFHSLDPSRERGVRVDQGFGSDNLRRSFLRLDTGEFGPDWRASLSYSNQSAEKWKGSGSQKQQQVNTKLVGEVAGARVSAFVNHSARKEVDYQDMSKQMIGRLGWNWDNYLPDWNAALASARGNWSRGETSVDDAYYAGAGIRRDWLAGVTIEAPVNDAVVVKTTAYYHNDRGPSLWWTPYRASSATVPVSLRTVEYAIDRAGLLSSVNIEAGAHQINAGVWFEHIDFDQAMRFYSQENGPSSLYEVPSDPVATRWHYRFGTHTAQFHLRDEYRVSPELTLTAGVKSPHTQSSVSTLEGDTKTGSIRAGKALLPQAGFNYRLDERSEVFGAVARNMRAFKGSAMEDSPFATSAAGFNAIRDGLKPETSTTIEGGWRYREGHTEASLVAYHVDFRNRLLGIQQGSAIQGNPVVLSNVGRVASRGVEAGVSVEVVRHLNWFNSASFNDSKYKNDFVDNGSVVAVSGKQVVDSPRFSANSVLGYDNGGQFGNLGATWVGQRQYTYLNDNPVAGHALFNLALGARKRAVGGLREVSALLAVTNLLDRRYIAALGTNGFVTSDPAGTAQTLLPGAPRSLSLTLGARF